MNSRKSMFLIGLGLLLFSTVQAQVRKNQRSYAVPNYVFTDDSKIAVAIVYGYMESKITVNDNIYKDLVRIVKDDLEAIGIKPGWYMLMDRYGELGIRQSVNRWDVVISFNFSSSKIKSKVDRKKLGSTTMIIRRSRAKADSVGTQTKYFLGGAFKSNRLTYPELIDKFKADIDKAPEGYFVKSLSASRNTPILPANADTVNYYPKDLNSQTLLVCEFHREDFRLFKEDNHYEWVVSKLKKHYPFKIHFCDLIDHEIPEINAAEVKYVLRIYTKRLRAVGDTKVITVYYPIFYISDLETGKVYLLDRDFGETKYVSDSPSAYAAAKRFCGDVKTQFDIK